jgi:hypothetical protein
MVPMFFFGFLAQQILTQGCQLIGEQNIRKNYPVRLSIRLFKTVAIKRVAFFLGFLLASISLLQILRVYQETVVRALLKNYEQLLYGTREIEVSKINDGTIRLRPSANMSQNNFPLRTGYWGLELDGAVCGKNEVNVQIQYLHSNPYYNTSRGVTFDARTPLRYTFHTYSSVRTQFGSYTGFSEFNGIVVNEEDFPCIRRFGELKGFEKLPLLMNLTFREGWEKEALYQTIGRKISNINAKRIGSTIFTFPDNLVVSEKQTRELLARVSSVTAKMSLIDKNATVIDGTVIIKGDAPTSYAYALQLPPENSKGRRYLVAEGELFNGGLTLGLLKNGQWAGQVNITSPGKFRIVMKPDGGDYTATLAHNVPGQKSNNFTLTKLGWTSEAK